MPKKTLPPKGEQPQKEDPRWARFLERIRKVPDRAGTLEELGISHTEFSEKIRLDDKFAAEYSRAFDAGIDSLEDEGIRRAMFGVEEPIFHKGFQCGSKTRYSDTLLMFFLEANRAKYRNGTDFGRRPLSDEAKTRMRSLFEGVEEMAGEIEEPPPATPPKRRRRSSAE